MPDKAEAAAMVAALEQAYPDIRCGLEHQDAWQLLVSVRLSAQCTDKRVNQVTPALFAAFPTPQAMAAATQQQIEDYIRTCGMHHGKAKDILQCAQMLVARYDGQVPDSMQALLTLPGVGRKSANLILGDVFGVRGVVVADTHCIRIAGRLGLTDGSKDPLKVEQALRALLPPEKSNDFCHRLVVHGRAVCTARKAHCESCCLRALCAQGRSQTPGAETAETEQVTETV